MVCELCKKDKKLDRHHTNYEEVTTINVCRKCHRLIHTSNKYPHLKANKPEGFVYKKQLKEGNKLKLIEIDDEVWKQIKIRAIEKEVDTYKIVDLALRNHLR